MSPREIDLLFEEVKELRRDISNVRAECKALSNRFMVVIISSLGLTGVAGASDVVGKLTALFGG